MSFFKRISIFERAVVLSTVFSITALGFIVLNGDNVGVQVSRFGPSDVGTPTSSISIQFDDEMDRASVERRFSVTPDLDGQFSWNGSRLIFNPSERMEPDSSYRVEVTAGAVSIAGRELLETFTFEFRIRGARVVYLKPEEDGIRQNLWIANPAGDEPPQRLTESELGIIHFDVSPNGDRIVFRESSGPGGSAGFQQLKVIDIQTGAITQLTLLRDSHLSEPQWNYDGTRIAYTRIDTGARVPGLDPSILGNGVPRVWIFDLSETPNTNQRLLPPEAGTSYAPHWSPTENVIAVGSDPLTQFGERRITVVDLDEDRTFYVDSNLDETISFSSDGEYFMTLDRTGADFRSPTIMWQVNVGTEQVEQRKSFNDLTSVQDVNVTWQPGQPVVAALRDSIDGVHGRTTHLYLVNHETGETTAVFATDIYDIQGAEWSPSGSLLAVDRFQRFNADGSNATDSVRDIVIYNPATGDLTVLDQQASSPQWVP